MFNDVQELGVCNGAKPDIPVEVIRRVVVRTWLVVIDRALNLSFDILEELASLVCGLRGTAGGQEWVVARGGELARDTVGVFEENILFLPGPSAASHRSCGGRSESRAHTDSYDACGHGARGSVAW